MLISHLDLQDIGRDTNSSAIKTYLILNMEIFLDCSVLKVEPWNSIKVTFSIPKKAAKQLRELAQSNSSLLKELDILTVQVQGRLFSCLYTLLLCWVS